MSEHDNIFVRSAPLPAAPPPPEAFLRAVAARRRGRCAKRIAAAGALAIIAGISGLLVLRPASTDPALPTRFIERDGRATDPFAEDPNLPTAFALLQLNRDFDVDNIILPEIANPHQQPPVHLGLALDPHYVDNLLAY